MWVGGEDYRTGVVVGLCLDPPDKPRARLHSMQPITVRP